MHIGFDVSQTGKDKAGCGYAAYSLVRALASLPAADDDFMLYASFGPYYWDTAAPAPEIARLPRSKLVLKHSSFDEAEEFWRAYDARPVDEPLGAPDIVHSNNFFVPRVLQGARLVYTLYDLSFLHHPEWHTEMNWATTFLGGVYYASLLADGIVAISEHTRDDFLRFFPYFPRERIWAVPLASRFPIEGIKPRPPEPLSFSPREFWLAVGTLEPRKNYPLLLQAYAALVQEYPDAFPLAIAGGQGWRTEYLQAMISSLGLDERVHLLGYVTDAELQWLYANCFAFVYPSLFEGFGLPVLEAMSMGAAVITSDATSLPEVAGDAALLVDPTSVADLAAAMKRLQEDKTLWSELRKAAIERASRFSWQKTAQTVRAIYQEVIDLPKMSRPLLGV